MVKKLSLLNKATTTYICASIGLFIFQLCNVALAPGKFPEARLSSLRSFTVRSTVFCAVVFGPAPIIEITKGYFGPKGVLSHDLRARTELPRSQEIWVARGGTLPRPWPSPLVNEIKPGEKIKGNGWAIQSCKAPHAQPLLECMAFALSSGGKKFVYSGDAGLCPEVAELSKNADVLLHWRYRLDTANATPEMNALTPTSSEIGAMANRVDAKALILNHFRKYMDKQSNYNAAERLASDAFGRKIKIAEDLQEIKI